MISLGRYQEGMWQLALARDSNIQEQDISRNTYTFARVRQPGGER